MVCKKRLELGFSGYGAPIVPRAPRSIRRRKGIVEEEKLCAFELLASVAGKLLEENEGSASSNAAELKIDIQDEGHGKDPPPKDDMVLKSESFDRGSCDESIFVPETPIQEHNLFPRFKGIQESDASEQLDCDMKLGVCEEKGSKNSGTGPLEQLQLKVEYGSEVHSRDVKDGDLSVANLLPVKDQAEDVVNTTNSLVNSESSVKLPLYREQWNNVKIGIRDDDENFPGCNKFPVRRTFRQQPRIGHRRVRKMIASRYWKTVPKLKDYELYTTSEGMNTFYRYRKSVIFSRERFQQAPIKKRRLSSNHRLSSGKAADATSTYMKVHSKSKEHHVTVSISSFKVPELYVEVPESATVGSLKRTVLEAVTAILGGGIRVGVVFEGQKVRDDNRTLEQAGISQCSNLDNLGFTLEPSLAHMSSIDPKSHPPVLCDAANSEAQKTLATSGIGDSEMIKAERVADDNMVVDGADPQNMALVPVCPVKAQALAAVPLNQKPKRSEALQRRTRRPFSVAEVEALVEAVEKLGTGRWRDVKMRAFENADHRTYVDLKDKWKTLVHTASISPQQRRGEPVPHELLSRVLSAHSYWSHHQSKHGKLQAIEAPRIPDSWEAAVGA